MEVRRTANVARSLQAIATQVSAYVRLASPPPSLPAYVRLNPFSEWSKSFLLCTAVETMTLPTHLRQNQGRPGSLTEYESILNNTGSRTIFELSASIASQGVPTGTSLLNEKEGRAMPFLGTAFDIDYSPRRRRLTPGQTTHRFSQVEVQRCISESQMPLESSVGMVGDTTSVEM